MSDEELAYMGAAEIADKVRRRLLSPVEIVDACIARIERRNPSLNAFVFNGFDDARREAKAAEGAIMSGVAVGPLHGVPSAIKDLFDFKPGWPFTFGGVRAMRNCVADWHCIFAERIEKAGAILLGKTNSPTMGLRGTCDNFLFGPTRNPFDLRKNAGGSSGGSAAAVADGLVPFAEGTDAGGSIRIPAAWCNVMGFKPSSGRVPVVLRPNAFAGAMPFVAEGPISRTVEDAALVLNALAGYPIGYFHIDIAEVRTAQGKLYLLVAIDRTSKFAFVELHEKVARRTAGDFLRRLIAAVPYKVHTVLTDNGTHFTTPGNTSSAAPDIKAALDAGEPVWAHAFEYACAQNDIDHRLTKPKHPWTNGQVERMNRTIKDATVKRYFYETHDQLRVHLRDFVDAYNFARRLKTLRGLTPYEFVCKAWTSQPQRFKLNPLQQTPGLNI